MLIELRPDGQPVDQKLRASLMKLRAIVKTQPGRCISRERSIPILETILSNRRINANQAAEVWDAAVDAEIIIPAKGDLFRFKGGERGKTRADRAARFEEYVTSIAGRLCVTEQGRSNARSLIKRTTRVHGAHRVTTSKGEGVFVATKMTMTAEGPTMTAGKVILIGSEGLCVRTIPGKNITVQWNDDWPIVSVNLASSRLDDKLTQTIASDRIIYTWDFKSATSTLCRMSRDAFNFLEQSKIECEKLIGESVTQRKWRGFMMSVGKARRIDRLIVMTVLGLLDPVVRRIALRHPYADFAFYSWLKAGSATENLRRSQASDAFPLFTCHLKELDEVVQAGAPLLPALAEATGLSQPHLRTFAGAHWQRLGKLSHAVIDRNTFGKMRGMVPERIPKTRKEWAAFGAITHLHQWIPSNKLRDVISANWIGYADVLGRDFYHAVSTAARDLAPLTTGKFSRNNEQEVNAAVRSQVCGENFGIKRMRKYNAEWHKGEARRSNAIRLIKTGLFGDERASWPPLTDENFECTHGHMTWILDEDGLVAEGKELRHCVGSYAFYCIDGRSHIAAVFALDGSRSTVEFRIQSDGSLKIAQHHSYKDSKAGPGSEAVVTAFVAKYRKHRFEIKGASESVRNRRRGIVPAPPEALEALIEAYSDCLPESFLRSLLPTPLTQLAA